MVFPRSIFIVIVTIALSACSADMVSSPGAASSSPYAPINEASRFGVIKYLNQGADAVIRQRREDAYRQMYSACSGKYRIDAEGPNAEGGAVVQSRSGAFWAQSQYWYIQFSCVP